MPVNLEWLDSTGWLKGEKSTVQVPQSVLQELVDEIRGKRGVQFKGKSAPTVQAIERLIVALHVAAQDEGEENAEMKWVTGYTLRLLKACQEVLFHLERVSSPDFVPRTKLEAAMRDVARQ